jgi:CRISPR/Cas system CMR-associated protein Cmr5 small subunit
MKTMADEKSKSGSKAVSNKGQFTSENQPTGAQMSLGWWKKRKGKLMIQALLQMAFDGTSIDPETQKKRDNEIKKQAAIYFNVPEIAITNEMIMTMKQIALAVQKNDTAAYNSVLDRAYGKPKEHVEVEEVAAPKLVFNYGTIGMPDKEQVSKPEDAPEISESENDVV